MKSEVYPAIKRFSKNEPDEWWADEESYYGPPKPLSYVLATDDGAGLIPAGKHTLIYGSTGLGKTWIPIKIVVDNYKLRRIAYLGSDEGARGFGERLQHRMKITPNTDQLRIAKLSDPRESIDMILDWLGNNGILIIDTVESEGGKTNDNQEYRICLMLISAKQKLP